jgi:hypothetical protein
MQLAPAVNADAADADAEPENEIGPARGSTPWETELIAGSDWPVGSRHLLDMLGQVSNSDGVSRCTVCTVQYSTVQCDSVTHPCLSESRRFSACYRLKTRSIACNCPAPPSARCRGRLVRCALFRRFAELRPGLLQRCLVRDRQDIPRGDLLYPASCSERHLGLCTTADADIISDCLSLSQCFRSVRMESRCVCETRLLQAVCSPKNSHTRGHIWVGRTSNSERVGRGRYGRVEEWSRSCFEASFRFTAALLVPPDS